MIVCAMGDDRSLRFIHTESRPMLAPSTFKDHLSVTCGRCRKIVHSHRELRSVELARTRLVVPDVLVDVCHECGHMIAFAPESLAQLREAGVK